MSKELTCYGVQVLKAFISVPQSSLLGYTATDKGPTSNVVRNVAHKSMSNKVLLILPAPAQAGCFHGCFEHLRRQPRPQLHRCRPDILAPFA